MTRPGTPPLPGRRPSPDGSTGDVPPFYWVSTAETGTRTTGSYGSARGETSLDQEPPPAYPGLVPPPRNDQDVVHPPTSYYETVRNGGPGYDTAGYETAGYDTAGYDAVAYDAADHVSAGHDDGYGAHSYYPVRSVPDHHGYESRADTGGFRQAADLLDRSYDETGPIVEPDWWHHYPGDELPQVGSGALPPRPPSPWERLAQQHDDSGDSASGDDATRAHHAVPWADPVDPYVPTGATGPPDPHDHQNSPDHPDRHEHPDPRGEHPRHRDPRDQDLRDQEATEPAVWDQTGGLEVIGAHVEEPGRRRQRRNRAATAADASHRGEESPDDDGYPRGRHADPDGTVHDGDHGEGRHDGPAQRDEDIPLQPYDPKQGRQRRRRRPLAILLSLVVLGGLVVGIVVGGQALLRVIDPSSRDFTGQGTGSVDIRVRTGDTLSDIARTLVEAGVIASIGPFVTAAEDDPAATSIQPGVYSLREGMSGQAALDRLLDPAARMLARVTIPEGLTVASVLQRIADGTGTPVEELQAAGQDPASLGLPAYANGQLEGFLFPATYDFEPGTTAAEMLRKLVARFTETATSLQLEQRAAALGRTPYEIVTIASMVESETRLDRERPDVAQVIYNRLTRDMPLGIDATIAYGLGKNGNDLTVADLQTDSPYNTRTRKGLPPTPISAPGEASLEAALNPSSGDYLYYVLQSEEGEHFFTSSAAEFEAARQRCADAGLGCGGG